MKYTYMNIFVTQAVCTMFPCVCLDNGITVVDGCLGHRQWHSTCRRVVHFDVSKTTNIESMVTFCYTDTRSQRHTIYYKHSIVVICSDVEVLVLSVVVLFAANMTVIIMSLEFGRRPRNCFQERRALWTKANISLVRWKYMSSGYYTKACTEYCNIIRIVNAEHRSPS